MPKVTVLMSTYNREGYIREAIESVLAQTFQEFEFLIVNDGSVDRSREIILSYQDSRIRLIENNQNLGIPRSLNKGLNLAQGELVARLDSDDILEPERLARQVAFLEANPETALVGSGYQEIDKEGNLLGEYELPCDSTELRWGLLFYTPFLSSSIMFRRAILQSVGLYNENFPYAQDHELWVRIAQFSPVANLNECLVKYRVHPSSITLFHETRQYELLLESCFRYASTLLCSDDRENAIDKDLFRNIQFLLDYSQYRNWRDFDIERVEEIVQTIFELSDAFCNYYNLSRSVREKHQSMMLDHVSSKLINLASNCAREERYSAWKLVVQACQIRKLTLLSISYQVVLLKLIIGPAFVRFVQQSILQPKLTRSH